MAGRPRLHHLVVFGTILQKPAISCP